MRQRTIVCVILSVLIPLSCDQDEPPSYPVEPFIKNASLEFIRGSFFDTLALTFTFRDGDFDLGFSHSEIADRNSPYHFLNFFTESNGALTVVESSEGDVNGHIILPAAGVSGKLATYRRLLNAVPSAPEYSCADYYLGNVYLRKTDAAFLNDTDNIVGNISFSGQEYYVLQDTFLVVVNPNHYNIAVDYFIEQQDGSLKKFDWARDIPSSYTNCFYLSFNGRFYLLSGQQIGSTGKDGPFRIKRISKNAGELRFAMVSLGFRQLFKGKNIKIQVSIKDRALNQSNTIETEPILIPE
jgi:hypothetical protein